MRSGTHDSGDKQEGHVTVWQQSLKQLRQDIPPQQYMTWIEPLQAGLSGDALCLYAPNAIVKKWVEERYGNQISSVVRAQCSDPSLNLVFVVGAKPEENDTTLPPSPPVNGGNGHDHSRQGFSGGRHGRPLNHGYTFAGFVQGDSNKLACAGAQGVVEHCGSKTHNPFFICGATGLGKTHLMHAIGNAIKDSGQRKKIVCCNSEDFVNDMVRCLRFNMMEDFKQHYRNTDVLLIDDVQFFVGKERSQDEVFHTIDQVREYGGQVILTCDRYPNDLRDLEARLRSRFSWGLTAEIDSPDMEMRAAILLQKANEVGCVMDEGVAVFIAEQVQSNVRDLQGILNRVVHDARSQRTAVSMDVVREAIRDVRAHHRDLHIDEIKKQVAAYYNIRASNLVSAGRARSTVRPRQIAMCLARDLTRHSYPEIGDAFGGRDHTTVMHACKNIKRLCREDRVLANDYQNLSRELGG